MRVNGNLTRLPLANVISTILARTENYNFGVTNLSKIILQGFVRTIGVTDNNLKSLIRDILDLISD